MRRRPGWKLEDKRERERQGHQGKGYVESQRKLEQALEAAVERNRIRLAEQRAELARARRLSPPEPK